MTLRATGARIGAYTLRERLALGGMGEVWVAADASGASLVLKFPGGRNPRDPLYQELLRNEAALGRATAHPNVVRVVELGEHGGEPFLALEHVDGVDLYRLQRALQHTQRRMESPLASHLVRELLAGLGHVHALQGSNGDGLVHRDVSPSNVFLSVEGDVKLGDFGISTPVRVTLPPPAAGATPTPPSLPRVQRGKLAYMAPEQLLGFGADPRVDLFAAGVILAELLTGRPLFAHGSDAGTVLSAREGQIEALNDLLVDHPPSLVSVVLRALARSPAERFQTADEFRDALLPHAGDPGEARPLLAALVTWGRAASRALTHHDHLAVGAGERERRRSTHPPPEPQHAWAPADADQTREVPLAYYEVVGASGRARGRYTFARLLELAFTGSIEPDERVVGPDGVSRRADEMPELAAHLLSRNVTPPAVEGAQADWADALPACTFLHALARAALAEEDGMLVAEAPPARKEVFLREGRLTRLTTNLAAESLGDYLAQAGLVNPGELDMAMAILPRFDGDLSRALVELGLVDAARLGPIVARHARERFYDLFRWRRGTLRFYRGIAPSGPGLALNLDVFEALRRGAQMLDDPAEHFAPCLDKRVGLRDTRRALPRLGLGPVALQLLGLADGHATVRALVQRLSAEKRAPPAEVFRDLHLLIEVGAVELR